MGRRKTTEEFIQEATSVHKGRYDYSKVVYKNTHTPVVIICQKHGEFKQHPSDHLYGRGCPFCSAEKHRGYKYERVTNSDFGMRNEPSYIVWSNLLRRCLDDEIKAKLPTYQNCTLCEEWHEYSTFRDWYYDPCNGYKDGYQLDKDILVKGNKLYSPETCCFVPHKINNLFRVKPKKDGLPHGIVRNGKGYQARFTINGKSTILQGSTIEEAFLLYKEMRETKIKELATEYFSRGEITEKVYNAMMNYTVSIND